MPNLKSMVSTSVGEFGLDQLRRIRRRWRTLRRSMQRPVDSTRLEVQLREAGLMPGDTVMVHSSLARLGNVRGGTQAVIQALQRTVGPEGTIMMPAFIPAEEAFRRASMGSPIDLRTERSLQGAISESFRLLPGVMRSSHPFSSVCAWGRNASFVTNGHHRDSRICHIESPIGRLLQLEGKVLGLGVDMGPVSFYHVIEDTWDRFPFNTYDDPRLIAYIDPTGALVERPVRYYSANLARNRIDAYSHLWIRQRITEFLDSRCQRHEFRFGHGRAWIIPATRFAEGLKSLAERQITIYLDKEQWERLGQPAFCEEMTDRSEKSTQSLRRLRRGAG
ncbi:MAG: AAC(3) family N-acetyltransferase [Acetobacteraceae bacterium]|nr:AAC(3) family N-acetyltransferase [Acetobacteraceae bacterium]